MTGRTLYRWITAGFLALILLAAAVPRAVADVSPGWSLFTTDAARTTLFGVNWRGVPLGTFDFGGAISNQYVGSTDTIWRRLGTAGFPDGPGAAISNSVAIELAALSLASVEPVDLGAGSDIHYLTLQSDRGGPASTGVLDLEFADGPGGTFDSFFDVFFDIRIGGPGGSIVISNIVTVTISNLVWGPLAPPGALLLDGVNHRLNGENPNNDFWPLEPIFESGPNGAVHALNVTPAIPEAGTFWVVAPLGLLAATSLLRRRHPRSSSASPARIHSGMVTTPATDVPTTTRSAVALSPP